MSRITTLFFLLVLACSTPNYEALIAELELLNQRIAEDNLSRIDFFEYTIAELEQCDGKEYNDLRSVHRALIKLTELKHRIITSKEVESTELLRLATEFHEAAKRTIRLEHLANQLSGEINKDLEILNSELGNYPTHVWRQLFNSKLQRWNLIVTEQELSSYALDPC